MPAPPWTDRYGGQDSGASAQHLTSGTAPHRVLTVEWLNCYDLNGDAKQYSSFQQAGPTPPTKRVVLH